MSQYTAKIAEINNDWNSKHSFLELPVLSAIADKYAIFAAQQE